MSLGGRPREFDLNEYADKLLDWAKLPDSFNFNGFCALNLISPKRISEWAKINDAFSEAYEITRSILADRREKGLVEGKVHTKAYDLNVTVYDEFTKLDHAEKKKDSEQGAAKIIYVSNIPNDPNASV